jgi:alkanesulfonate monooxygenase SsuD/methylene tetrahydromethanopterin reductase-like flavin-dependent oxidoreductase (luciferase family)
LRVVRFGDCWIPTDYTVEEYEKGRALLKQARNEMRNEKSGIKLASHLMVTIDQSKSGAAQLARAIVD